MKSKILMLGAALCFGLVAQAHIVVMGGTVSVTSQPDGATTINCGNDPHAVCCIIGGENANDVRIEVRVNEITPTENYSNSSWCFLRIQFNFIIRSGDCDYQVSGWYEIDGNENITGMDICVNGIQSGCGDLYFASINIGNSGGSNPVVVIAEYIARELLK